MLKRGLPIPGLLLVLLATSMVVTGVAGVTVSTLYGPVRGQMVTLNDGRKVNSFMGIPFAKPPVGNLRWKAPVDPANWTEPFVADRLRSACLQERTGVLWLTHLFWYDYSEDCLHLNIYTPHEMSGGPYPVMIWLHGGGFLGGANIQYPGHFLAARDLVIVVPNYRLGALGFASTGDEASPGNYGLLDQVKAMEFVRDNIANFGGDPSRVTLFGQSAGAASSALHTLSPLSEKLFHQVILESGNDLAMWAFLGNEQKPWEYTAAMARDFDCPTEDNHQMMDCLRTKPGLELSERAVKCTPGYFCQGFAPSQDNVFIHGSPSDLRKAGKYKKVPTMIGQMTDDGSFYSVVFLPELMKEGLTRSEFETWLRGMTDYFTIPYPGKSDQVYDAIHFYYSPWGQLDDKDANRAKVNEIITDVGFGFSADVHMKLVSRDVPTYAFLMKYRSVNASGVFPEWMGVPHNGEIPYVWGWPYIMKEPIVRSQSRFTHNIIPYNDDDDKYVDYYMTLWANFARTGNPTPVPVRDPLTNTFSEWEKFNPTTQKTFWIDRQIKHVSFYKQRNYALWQEYLPSIVKGGNN